VIERAKHLTLDGIACGLMGARAPWSKAAFDAISQGNHAIIGYKEVHYANAKPSPITLPSRSAPAPAPAFGSLLLLLTHPLLSASVPSPPPC
jgi:hypothetical protein